MRLIKVERHVKIRFSQLADLADGSILRDSNHTRINIGAGQSHNLPERVLAGPVFLSHGLIDEYYRGSIRIVGNRKAAAPHNARTCHIEEVRTDRIELDRNRVAQFRMTGQQSFYSNTFLGKTERRADSVGHSPTPGSAFMRSTTASRTGASGSCVQASNT